MSDSNFTYDELLAHKYSVVASVSRGSCFDVLLAFNLRVGLRVALTILHADLAQDEELARRVESEFETLSWQVHPNLVRIYDDEHVRTHRVNGRTFVWSEG